MIRKSHALAGILQLFGVLTVLMGVVALAQMTSAARPYRKAQALSVLPDASRDGHVSGSPVQEKVLATGAMIAGAPLFLPAVTYGTGAYFASSVATADVNGDGKLDILVVNQCPIGSCAQGLVSVLLGNGDGTFQSPVSYNSGGWVPLSVAVADVNGDGKPDLVVANCGIIGLNTCSNGNSPDGVVGVLLGNGDGSFQPVVAYDSGGVSSRSVAIADVNNDGKPDLLVGNECASGSINCLNGTMGVLLGNGDGTFQKVTTYDTRYDAYSLAIADVNGDGQSDVLVTSAGNSKVGVLLGNGDGTFQPVVVYDPGGRSARSVAVADVNGDGKPDLLVANVCTIDSTCPNSVVGVLLGNGDGTFQPAVTYDTGGFGASSIEVADVNGDGKPDVLVANMFSNTVGLLLGKGDGTFKAVVTYSSGGSFPFSIAVADVNGDAEPDLLVAECANSTCSPGAVGVLLNNTGHHTPTATTLVSSADPVNLGQRVTYAANVVTQSGGTAMGTVVFRDGGKSIAIVTLVGNQVHCNRKYYTPGTHTITATYSGDTKNTESVSSTLVEQANQGFPSKTVLTTSGSPSLVGKPVAFTATVTSSFGTIPDGSLVTFYDKTTAIGTSATAGGIAAFTTSILPAKTHTIKATYAGDVTFQPSSGMVTQIVNKYPTTTVLSSSLNPSLHGQAVIFTATVTPSGLNPPTGTVKFLDGTTTLGTAILSGATATLTKSTLAVGTHPVTAQYLGDAVSGKSTSSVVNQVVQ
jgi:hypothetical protein